MFKIGEFSKLSRVPVKTLRYYDEIGLLQPAKVDRFTSYRYYSADQLPRLNRILALKDLGLSLAQIGRLLDDSLSPAQMRGMLRLKQAQLQQRVQEEQARLARVEARLRQIERKESTMPSYDVVTKKVDSQRVAALRDVIPTYGAQGQLWGELVAYLEQHKVKPVGPCFTLYYDDEYKEQDVDAEVCEPVSADTPLSNQGRVKIYDLPAIETMACVIHQGSYDTIGQAYSALLAWIDANGYRIVGPNREVYLRGVESGDDPSTYVTEVQFPVAKV